jgi:hypothetical protein
MAFREHKENLTYLPYGQGDLPVAADREVGFQNSLNAAVQYNPMVAAYNIFTGQEFERDPDFNLAAAASGNPRVEKYRSAYVKAQSQAEFDHIDERIKRQQRDDEILAAAGAEGIAAQMLMGSLSPTMFIPLVGQARGAKAIRDTFLLAGAAATADELPLLADLETYSAGDAAIGVAAGTVLGGLLGSAGVYLQGRARDRVVNDMVRTNLDGAILNPDGSQQRVLTANVEEAVTATRELAAERIDFQTLAGKQINEATWADLTSDEDVAMQYTALGIRSPEDLQRIVDDPENFQPTREQLGEFLRVQYRSEDVSGVNARQLTPNLSETNLLLKLISAKVGAGWNNVLKLLEDPDIAPKVQATVKGMNLQQVADLADDPLTNQIKAAVPSPQQIEKMVEQLDLLSPEQKVELVKRILSEDAGDFLGALERKDFSPAELVERMAQRNVDRYYSEELTEALRKEELERLRAHNQEVSDRIFQLGFDELPDNVMELPKPVTRIRRPYEGEGADVPEQGLPGPTDKKVDIFFDRLQEKFDKLYGSREQPLTIEELRRAFVGMSKEQLPSAMRPILQDVAQQMYKMLYHRAPENSLLSRPTWIDPKLPDWVHGFVAKLGDDIERRLGSDFLTVSEAEARLEKGLIHPEHIESTRAQLASMKAGGNTHGLALPPSAGRRGWVVMSDDYLTKSSVEGLETLAHEVGHLTETLLFANAPAKTQLAIFRDYAKWRMRNTTKAAGRQRKPVMGQRRYARFDGVAGRKHLNELPSGAGKYDVDFREWYADQVARHLTTNATGKSVVDKFFARIAAVWKRVAAALRSQGYANVNVQKLFAPERFGPIQTKLVSRADATELRGGKIAGVGAGGSLSAATPGNPVQGFLAPPKFTGGVFKALARLNPIGRVVTQNISAAAKGLAMQMSDAGLRGARNAEGIAHAPGGTLEARVHVYDAGLATMLQKLDDAFARYILGDTADPNQLQGATVARIKSAVRPAPGKMNNEEFNRAAWETAQTGTAHPEEAVNKAAAAWNEFAAEIREVMKEAHEERLLVNPEARGLIPDDPNLGPDIENYVTHVYDLDAIAKNPTGFLNDLAAHRKALLAGDFQKDWEGFQKKRGNLQEKLLDPEADDEAVAALLKELEELEDAFDTKWRNRGAEDLDIKAGRADFAAAAREGAKSLYDKIVGMDNPVAGLEILGGKRGPELMRTLNMPLDIKQKWLVTDLEKVARIYNRRIAPDIELYRATGSVNAAPVFAAMAEDVNRLVERLSESPVRPKSKKLFDQWKSGESVDLKNAEMVPFTKEEKDAAIGDVSAIQRQLNRDMRVLVQRFRHQRGVPTNPEGIGYRLGRAAMDANVFRLMGTVVVSSLPDIARPVMKMGLATTFRNGWAPFLTDISRVKLSREEARRMGIALDPVLHNRAQAVFDMWDDYASRKTRGERVMGFLANKTGLVAGFDRWTAEMKQISASVAFAEISHALAITVGGKAAKAKEVTRARTFLAANGLGDAEARKVWAQYQRPGGSNEMDGVWLPNTESWTDKAAQRNLAGAMQKIVNDVIVTPGLDRPSWMDENTAFKLVAQFRSFTFSSTNRVLLAGMQSPDMALANGMAFSLALGALSYYTWAATVGGDALAQASEFNADKWADEAIDRSGLLGVFAEGRRVLERIPATQNAVTFSNERTTRRASQGLIGAVAGPSFDLGEKVGNVVMGIDSPTQSTLHQARLMMAYQNVFYMRQFFDEMEERLGANLPERRN